MAGRCCWSVLEPWILGNCCSLNRICRERLSDQGLGRSGPADYDIPGFADTYMSDGHFPKNGSFFKNQALADTYRMIARGGRDAFYKGEIAERIVEFSKRHNGFLSMKDFADQHGQWVDPVSVDYRGYQVWELPPNGQGIAALQMLNILEGYDLASMGFNSAQYLHVLIEAKKLAFADRARYYADPEFAKIPLDRLLSKEYAAERRKLIRPDRVLMTDPPGDMPEEHDTIFMAVADKDGNMVSLIQSNSWAFGSGWVPNNLGFVLQNRGAMFNLDPEHPNGLEPHKRPFHTIIPSFVTRNGRPWLSFGVMGGNMQPQGHVQVLVNMIDFGMDIQEAGDAPRIRHMGSSQPWGERMEQGGSVATRSAWPRESFVSSSTGTPHKPAGNAAVFWGLPGHPQRWGRELARSERPQARRLRIWLLNTGAGQRLLDFSSQYFGSEWFFQETGIFSKGGILDFRGTRQKEH